MSLLSVVSVLGATSFTRVTTGPAVSDGGDSRSANLIDYDNDGYLDLQFTNGPNPGVVDFLYHNNGDGTFTKDVADPIVTVARSSDGATWGDADNDGDLDAFVASWWGQTNLFFLSDSGDSFVQVMTGDISTDVTYSETASWGDYDRDGDLDLYLANSSGGSLNILYENDGAATFSKPNVGRPVTDAQRSRVGLWGDYDNDGYPDLFVANESNNSNALYRNLGDGTFDRVTDAAYNTGFGDSFGGSWGDYDNDGDLDLFITNFEGNDNWLYRNDDTAFTLIVGDPVVSDGGFSVGSSWGDLDNDGDLDLVVANGFDPSLEPAFVYWNNGDGSFTRETTDTVATELGWSYGCALGDIDRDGDLDLAFARWFNAIDNNAIFLNNGNANHWLDVRFVGEFSNHFGIGVRVLAKATINGQPVWQMREITTQSGYAGQGPPEAHFGLGDATVVDSLIVQWPSGVVQVMEGVASDQLLPVYECGPDDTDSDGISDGCDNCPATFNPLQQDLDSNGIGDICQCVCDCFGDPECDSIPDVFDVISVVDVAFRSGPEVVDPNVQCPRYDTDVTCDDLTDVFDVVAFVDVAFRGIDPSIAYCDPCE